MKNDQLHGMTLGSCIGFVGGITTDKIVEVVILSFLGGILGAAGGTLWRHLKCKWPLMKKIIFRKKNNDE